MFTTKKIQIEMIKKFDTKIKEGTAELFGDYYYYNCDIYKEYNEIELEDLYKQAIQNEINSINTHIKFTEGYIEKCKDNMKNKVSITATEHIIHLPADELKEIIKQEELKIEKAKNKIKEFNEFIPSLEFNSIETLSKDLFQIFEDEEMDEYLDYPILRTLQNLSTLKNTVVSSFIMNDKRLNAIYNYLSKKYNNDDIQAIIVDEEISNDELNRIYNKEIYISMMGYELYEDEEE